MHDAGSMTKTVAGLFERLDEAQTATGRLLEAGFAREAITLVAHHQLDADTHPSPLTALDIREEARISRAARAMAGGVVGGTAGVLAVALTLAIPGAATALAVGPALSVLLGAAVGAIGGGLIGALTHLGIGEEHAHLYADGLRRGMALLAVTDREPRIRQAADIMRRQGTVNLDEYIGRWPARGWPRFRSAPPLSSAHAVTEDDSRAEHR